MLVRCGESRDLGTYTKSLLVSFVKMGVKKSKFMALLLFPSLRLSGVQKSTQYLHHKPQVERWWLPTWLEISVIYIEIKTIHFVPKYTQLSVNSKQTIKQKIWRQNAILVWKSEEKEKEQKEEGRRGKRRGEGGTRGREKKLLPPIPHFCNPNLKLWLSVTVTTHGLECSVWTVLGSS